jgi:acetoacetate decarboxylase
MRNGSFFVPREQIRPFFNPGSMNNEEGLYLAWETDPATARRVLPPQLDLFSAEHPIVMVYVVDIREPTFASWYMEGGIMMLARYREKTGAYMLNLQLSGPGACTGMNSGREFSGLPKKICEKIVVERNDTLAHAVIESKGRRIFDAEIELGGYNEPLMGELHPDAGPGRRERGACFLFRYRTDTAPDGHMTFPEATLLNYDSVTDYSSWEPAAIRSITMEPSLDDPWAEMTVVKPIGAAYSVNSNWVAGLSCLAQFTGDEADSLISYLFTGRWDRSTIRPGHQRYGQL